MNIINKEKRLLNAFGQVDESFITEAEECKKEKKKYSLLRVTAVAACLTVVALIGIGALRGRWFSGDEVAISDNGTAITFVKSDADSGVLVPDLNYEVTSRELTEEEVRSLFGDLSVTASAVFSEKDGQFIGIDGKVNGMKMIIATAGLPMLDTVIEGSEKVSEVNGVSVSAGYFLTDPNSKGEQTAIYFASFKLGSADFYVENAGARAEREAVRNALAEVIQKLIANGEPDITRF